MHNVVINGGGGDSEIVEGLVAIGICFMVVVAPLLIIFGFGRRRGKPGAPSAEQERASIELWDRARRMETRIEYLERVLDAEMPGWRSRS